MSVNRIYNATQGKLSEESISRYELGALITKDAKLEIFNDEVVIAKYFKVKPERFTELCKEILGEKDDKDNWYRRIIR